MIRPWDLVDPHRKRAGKSQLLGPHCPAGLLMDGLGCSSQMLCPVGVRRTTSLVATVKPGIKDRREDRRMPPGGPGKRCVFWARETERRD